MAFVTALTALGTAATTAIGSVGVGTLLSTGVNLAGLGMNIAGGMQQMDAAKEMENLFAPMSSALLDEYKAKNKVIGLEARQEGIRRRQAGLDFQRRRREIFRKSVIQASEGRSAAANQGALFSSGYKGGQAEVVGASAAEFNYLRSSYALGQQVFDINKEIFKQERDASKARSQYNLFQLWQQQAQVQQNKGSSLSSLGGAVAGLAEPLSNIGESLFSGGAAAVDPWNTTVSLF